MTRPLLFASDIHLSDADPATLASFVGFLRGPARTAQALYLLGDIFEYWAGDDDDDPLLAAIANELAALAEQGTAIFIQHGNRDFLLGPAFAARAQATLIADPYPLADFDQRFLLSHGDALCTDDLAYQAFRRTVREPAWQAAFLAQPLAARKAEIAKLRAASRDAVREKASAIMDVNDFAVATLLAKHPGSHLIHGHTHRPAMHTHEVQHGIRRRWVLPDWQHGKGGFLCCSADGIVAQPYPPPP